MIKFVVYVVFVLFLIVSVFSFVNVMEFLYCACIRKQVPFVPSNKKSRKAIVELINSCYGDAKKIVEIGSGYGGLSRFVARNTNADVVALENMFFTFCVSWILDLLSCSKKLKTVWANAFDYLDDTSEKFDVALIYLGPDVMSQLKNFSSKIDVLISLSFEISNMKPVRVIDLDCGYVLYNRKKYPYKLFVYELNNRK